MRHRLALVFTAALLVLTATFALGQQAQPDAENTVRVIGLQVVAPSHDPEDMFSAFNTFPGTSLAMEYLHESGGLLELDRDASRLESFTDDQDTNLLEGEARFGQSGISMHSQISDDGTIAMFQAVGPARPADGATRLSAKGAVVFRAATTKDTATAKNVALEEGTTIEAGPIPLTITHAGEAEWGDDPMQVTFQAKQELSPIAEIRFLDDQGNVIESQSMGSSTMTMMDDITAEKTYSLSQKVEAATIEIVSWQDMQQIEVPFDVTVGLGL